MSRKSNPTLGIVIPCYNEEAVLDRLLVELRRFAEKAGSPVFFLFVDDGSTDRTAELLDKACAEDARLACLHFSRNFGHQTAVSAGLRHIRGDAVAVLDADLQDPPDVLPRMLEKWKEGYDVVYGVRANRKEGALLRSCYAIFYRLLRKIANINMPLDAGDFSLMDRRIVDHLNRMPEHNRFVRGLRGWIGFRQVGVPYERAARFAGTPKYNIRRLLKLAFDGMISFSTVPLRIASWLGVFASIIGLLLLAWTIYSVIFLQKTPTGWASLSVMVIFFGGIQLIVLGIIGEYVGRIFEEVKNRPHYIVANRSGWLADLPAPGREQAGAPQE